MYFLNKNDREEHSTYSITFPLLNYLQSVFQTLSMNAIPRGRQGQSEVVTARGDSLISEAAPLPRLLTPSVLTFSRIVQHIHIQQNRNVYKLFHVEVRNSLYITKCLRFGYMNSRVNHQIMHLYAIFIKGTMYLLLG